MAKTTIAELRAIVQAQSEQIAALLAANGRAAPAAEPVTEAPITFNDVVRSVSGGSMPKDYRRGTVVSHARKGRKHFEHYIATGISQTGHRYGFAVTLRDALVAAGIH